MKSYFYCDKRIQLLSNDILRIEVKKGDSFLDENTLCVQSRTNFNGLEINNFSNNFDFNGYSVFLPEKGLKGLKIVNKNNEIIYQYKTLKNTGELQNPCKKSTFWALMDSTRVIIPEGGYEARNEKNLGYKVQENCQDLYILFVNNDAKKLRQLYVDLTGKPEMVRLATLGLWNSRYYKHNDESARNLLLDYAKHNVPLDNMVLDTDWRKNSDCGMGYEIDSNLFPDLADFFKFAHDHNVEITMNDHPQPIEGNKSVLEFEEAKYRTDGLNSILKLGLDTWWYDRNWITHLNSPTKYLSFETFGDHIFHSVMTNHYKKVSHNNSIYKRPIFLANINNIANGEYKRILDSSTHVYGPQWSGDIVCDLSSLCQEINNLVKTGNNSVCYYNSDIGGHIGNPDADTYLRWIQYGSFSPLIRPHCTCDVTRWREPWLYDENTLNIARDFINLRYRLLPVIYRYCFEAYKTGIPMFRSLALNYQNDKNTYNLLNEYMLGNDLLVSPICGATCDQIKSKYIVEPFEAIFYEGKTFEKELARKTYKNMFLYWHNEKPHENVPMYDFCAKFSGKFKFDKEVDLILAIDDGYRFYVDGKLVAEDWSDHAANRRFVGTYKANREYKIDIEYYQAKGDACVEFFTSRHCEKDRTKVYLPEGEWLDVFKSRIYKGNSKHSLVYKNNEMPLFIRVGSIIPLAYNAQTTKNQKWNRLVFDYYPSKEYFDQGFIYEDDTYSTAYKFNQYKLSKFKTSYENNHYIIELDPSEGNFKGKKNFDTRNIKFKFHKLKNIEELQGILVNGEEINFKKSRRHKNSFPLNTDNYSNDSQVYYFNIKIDLGKKYRIEFVPKEDK